MEDPILKFLLLSLALVIAGCASPLAKNEQSSCGQKPTDQQANESVQIFVSKGNWKDPDSVRVRNIDIVGCKAEMIGGLLNGGKRYIGWVINFEVNAKNSYGGYTGFEAQWVLREANGMTHWWVK